ncbi:alpha/beta hydrolase [Paenibacillus mesophilus]|uniref:alpha/beta hydrolase n=1 Tax=Paenibacillus mesophilus TaxID=2582849 RepID=UPI001305432A|nr:alpha/beta hydrolase [Paenibacillus mesophilus]
MTVLHRGSSKIFYKLKPAHSGPGAEQLILLHGNLFTHACFDSMVPFLSDRFSTIRYDLRGFGQSDLGDEPLTVQTYHEDLLHLVRSLELRSFHLIGYGFGAIIAARFAASNPEIVKSLVLISMPIYPGTVAEKAQKQWIETPVHGTVGSADCIADLFASLPPDHPAHEKIDYSALPSTYSRITDASIGYRPMDDLARMKVPTLLLCGEEEHSSPVYLSLMAAFCLSEYKLYTVPDSPHIVVLDQPQLSANWIMNFMDRLDRTAAADETRPNSRDMKQYMKLLVNEEQGAAPLADELRVELMGGFHVYANGLEIKGGWNQRFAKNIFLYLLLYRSVSREQLCETLWPDLPVGKARSYLRVYLSHLKKLLEPSRTASAFLILEREDVTLYGKVVCDALDFIQDMTIALQEKDDRKKLELCGKLLQSMPLTFFQSLYDDWFLVLREEWEHNLASLGIWMADYFLQQGNPQEASVHIKQMLRILPKNEALVDKLIACYDRTKDTSNKEYWMKQKGLFDAS